MTEIHVVGAAIKNGDRILAAQRSARMSSPLKWEFAGGKVEERETHSQALQREIMEELGVGIKVGEFLASGEFIKGELKIILHVYEAELLGGTPVPREHSRLEWIGIDRIRSLDWAEADIPACKKLEEKYMNGVRQISGR